ncbi:hypothetical protein [Yokenella regensburgei]|uniref:hypothetical protein n=1 Tax=Yokenella regensburgei TaxID=158877 RepID=UPI003EDA1B90
MANPMIELDDRHAVRSDDIRSIEVLGSRIIVYSHSTALYVLDNPDEASARAARHRLLTAIREAERYIAGISPVRYAAQATCSSLLVEPADSGATNAATSLSSYRELTPALRDHLQALLDAGDCEAIVRAIGSARNAIY